VKITDRIFVKNFTRDVSVDKEELTTFLKCLHLEPDLEIIEGFFDVAR